MIEVEEEEWTTIEDLTMDELLKATGKKPNLVYLGDEVAVRLGIPREDLDLYRDDSGIVCINKLYNEK